MGRLRSRFKAHWLLLAPLLSCGCSETGGYQVELQFESAELSAQTAWVRVELSESCEPRDDPGTGDVIRNFTSPIPLDSVSPGERYVRVWAYDAACLLVASGCTTFDAVAGANVTLTLTLISTTGPSDCSQCDPSTCDNADGGTVPETCAPFEVVCDDLEDGDCDGFTDCEDPDCSGATCSDDNGCTVGDTCTNFECVGVGMACDDENPCTDNTCTDGACTFVDNSKPCDDGFWCNGVDQCEEGSCSSHSEAPCDQFCNESKQTCDQCAADADCGSQQIGTWTTCQFSGTCPTTGTRTRVIKTPQCTNGSCTVQTTTETGSCTRASTNGKSCGSVRYGAWSGCNYSNACDQSATRTRAVFTPTCSAGECSEVRTTQTANCSRTVSNGTSCGGTWLRCCSGVCRDLRTNTFCGGCGINCTSQGRTCVASGTGGYQCTCATSNAQCNAIYFGSSNTCYQDRCNCQCAVSQGVCRDGGCGSNFFCHDCLGQNFCAPFGGAC